MGPWQTLSLCLNLGRIVVRIPHLMSTHETPCNVHGLQPVPLRIGYFGMRLPQAGGGVSENHLVGSKIKAVQVDGRNGGSTGKEDET